MTSDTRPYAMLLSVTAPDRPARPRPAIDRRGRPGVPCECIETGDTYPSMEYAASVHGTTVGNIANSIRTGQRAKGYRFRRKDRADT